MHEHVLSVFRKKLQDNAFRRLWQEDPDEAFGRRLWEGLTNHYDYLESEYESEALQPKQTMYLW